MEDKERIEELEKELGAIKEASKKLRSISHEPQGVSNTMGNSPYEVVRIMHEACVAIKRNRDRR